MPSAVQTREGRFAYLALGPTEGPKVLLAHGFPDHPPSFLPLMERLAEAGYRCVAPWLRGYGASTHEGPFHATQIGADLVAIADALGEEERWSLVGHDWGAVATYAALSQARGRFPRAVALAVPHPGAFFRGLLDDPGQLRRSWYMLFFQLPGLPEAVLERGGYALIRRLWRDWSPGYRLTEEGWEALMGSLSPGMPAPLGYYRALFRPPHEALVRIREQLTGPPIEDALLHLQGEEDGCIGSAVCAGQERYFCGEFESRVLPGVGHFLQLEDPDRVAELILGWLTPTRERARER